MNALELIREIGYTAIVLAVSVVAIGGVIEAIRLYIKDIKNGY